MSILSVSICAPEFLPWIRDNAGPCSHGHVCTATCSDIRHHKRAIEFTSSLEAKQILRHEIEELRCEDLTLDEVFGVTPVVHEKYCCREGRAMNADLVIMQNSSLQEFCDPQKKTFVDAWSEWSPCRSNGVKERTRRCYIKSRDGSDRFPFSSHPCRQRTLETETCDL